MKKTKQQSAKASLLGRIAASLSMLFRRKRLKSNHSNLTKMDFKSSTQSMGISMTDKIRNTFRFKWLKKHN